MSKTAEKHVHKFKRLRYKSGNEIFFCALPDCAQKLSTALALGKRSLCWRCGEPFIMNEYSLRLAKPHCDACHRPKNDAKFDGTHIDTIIHDEIAPLPLTLAERLQQTINQAKPEEDEL